MKVKFIGIKSQEKSSGGCLACGQKRVSQFSYTHAKRMVLPSGRAQLFTMGKTYEVSEKEGQFLLEYTYNLNGMPQYPFIKLSVKDD